MNLSVLYQVRGVLSQYIKRFEPFIKVGLKFIAFLVLFRMISGAEMFTGTGIFNSFWVHLVLALVATLLPSRIGVLIAFAICVYNIFQASLIGAVIVGAMMLILYIAVARMFPDQIYFLVLIPLCIEWNLYLLVPLFAGLYVGVIAVVPVVVGVLVWALMQIIPAFMSLQMGESLDALPQMISDASTYGIDQITKNEQMVYLLIVSACIVLVVSLLKKLRIDYVHYIALGAGGVLGIFCLIMGKIAVDLTGNLVVLVLMGIVSMALLAVLEFLNLALNYKSVQNLEFEDEEYFYQVRLIPKINPVKKTKKEIINVTESEMEKTRVGVAAPSDMEQPTQKIHLSRRAGKKEAETQNDANFKPLRKGSPKAEPKGNTKAEGKKPQAPKAEETRSKKKVEEALDLFEDSKN